MESCAFGMSIGRSAHSAKLLLHIIKGRELDKEGHQNLFSLVAAWDKMLHANDGAMWMCSQSKE